MPRSNHATALPSSSRISTRTQAAKQSATVRHGSVVAQSDLKFGIVVGRFNDLVTKLLLEGAIGAFESHGASVDSLEV